MGVLEDLTSFFVERSRAVLGDNLAGIYLHGSAAMGCFNEKKSDIDLMVVVYKSMSQESKRRFMDMVVQLNAAAPEKGLELSVVKKSACNPFIYPTPFELHFSNAHLHWYKSDPSDYIEKMKGTDKDLAAHFTIIRHRGKCLLGEKIEEIFGEVREEFYFDSIWHDIKNAEEEITKNPTYYILNLCRVLAYKKDGLILSKTEGANWAAGKIPGKYESLVLQALSMCSSDALIEIDQNLAIDFAVFMTEQIGK
ncbi:MAG: aminoglycoside adenylyltransferase domain-containing protein [Christensenellales bacterium]|jgi:predicted nucleotidyltransferase